MIKSQQSYRSLLSNLKSLGRNDTLDPFSRHLVKHAIGALDCACAALYLTQQEPNSTTAVLVPLVIETRSFRSGLPEHPRAVWQSRQTLVAAAAAAAVSTGSRHAAKDASAIAQHAKSLASDQAGDLPALAPVAVTEHTLLGRVVLHGHGIAAQVSMLPATQLPARVRVPTAV